MSAQTEQTHACMNTKTPDLHALFVASSLHEAKNHANHLLLHLDQLATACQLSPQDAHLQPLQQDCQHLLHHLTQILHLYKSNQGYRLHREEVIIADFFEELQLRHPQTTLQVDPNLTWVFDEQLLLNLLDTALYNASQATATQIHLSAAVQDNYLHICIDDNGLGFPKEWLSQPLDQLHSSQLAAHKTGLGLYMAQQITAAHQHHQRTGYLQLNNQSSLGGGRLSVFLP